MKLPNIPTAFPHSHFRALIAGFAALSVSSSALFAQQSPAPAQSQVVTATTNAPTEEPAPKIPNDQLDSLVAPIALYPDPLVAQVLAASTYPLEIVQLDQFMANNKTLKDKALSDAVAKLPFDPSVQSLAAFPDVVKQLSQHVSWAMDLGNAFLAQQADVMDAVQRMRAKAKGTGNLQTTAQQTVETQAVEGGKEVIVIQPADPQVVYVPQYNPTVVYGAAPYPYPYVYPPGYGALAFGMGVAMGAAWGGCWGNCNWNGGGNININNNNNFNRNNVNNINRGQGNRPGQGGGGNWSHNPSHRGGAPYGDRGTAGKYGGRARQQPAGGAGNRPGGGTGAGNLAGRGQGAGGANRPGGGAGGGNLASNRPAGGAGAGNLGGANRPGGGAGAGSVGGANRPGGGAGASTRPAGGGSNSIGNRSVSSGGFGGNSAFGGGGGSSARSASSRGGHSMGGGGFSGGGGRGGGGGGRGGGGGGRRR